MDRPPSDEGDLLTWGDETYTGESINNQTILLPVKSCEAETDISPSDVGIQDLFALPNPIYEKPEETEEEKELKKENERLLGLHGRYIASLEQREATFALRVDQLGEALDLGRRQRRLLDRREADFSLLMREYDRCKATARAMADQDAAVREHLQLTDAAHQRSLQKYKELKAKAIEQCNDASTKINRLRADNYAEVTQLQVRAKKLELAIESKTMELERKARESVSMEALVGELSEMKRK